MQVTKIDRNTTIFKVEQQENPVDKKSKKQGKESPEKKESNQEDN